MLFVVQTCKVFLSVRLLLGLFTPFFSRNYHTVVDYCLFDNSAAHLTQKCFTLDHHPLNFPDHLPLTSDLDSVIFYDTMSNKDFKLNWKKAIAGGSTLNY